MLSNIVFQLKHTNIRMYVSCAMLTNTQHGVSVENIMTSFRPRVSNECRVQFAEFTSDFSGIA